MFRIPCYSLYSGASNGFFWCFTIGFALAYLWAIFYKAIPGWTNMLTDFEKMLELYYMFYLALFSGSSPVLDTMSRASATAKRHLSTFRRKGR